MNFIAHTQTEYYLIVHTTNRIPISNVRCECDENRVMRCSCKIPEAISRRWGFRRIRILIRGGAHRHIYIENKLVRGERTDSGYAMWYRNVQATLPRRVLLQQAQ